MGSYSSTRPPLWRRPRVSLATPATTLWRGPGVIDLEASVFRDFKPTERFTVQFRAEALNATNTPHFSNPSGNVTATTYGQVTGVSAASRLIDERYLRFSLRIKF